MIHRWLWKRIKISTKYTATEYFPILYDAYLKASKRLSDRAPLDLGKASYNELCDRENRIRKRRHKLETQLAKCESEHDLLQVQLGNAALDPLLDELLR